MTEKNTYALACPVCGQIQMISADSSLTEAEQRQQALLACNCSDGVNARRAKQRAEKAKENINILFEGDGEIIIDALSNIVPAIANNTFAKVSITTEAGIKATLTAKEQSIKVERTEKKTAALES